MFAIGLPPGARTSGKAPDKFDLQRYLSAQAPVYPQVLGELQRARKTSHWMWFVFPQLRGLGRSSMAHAYGLTSADEAVAYDRHPVLGQRLRECTGLVARAVATRSVHDIFGSPDNLKLRSCLTLFAEVSNDAAYFAEALNTLFEAGADAWTLDILKRTG